MLKNPTVNDVIQHRAYGEAKNKAQEYARDPEKLSRLLDDAAEKMQSARSGRLAKIQDSLKTAFRMVRASVRREYTGLPWSTLLLVIASFAYWVCPVDLIPDFLIGVGWFDDAALLGWTMQCIKSDLQDFLAWEASMRDSKP